MNQRDKIVRAASVIMSEKGYKGATFEAIAEAVGIHKSTIFHYFKDKQDLLEAVIDIADITENLQEILSDPQMTNLEKLRQAIVNHIRLLSEHVHYVRVYNTETRYLKKESRQKYLQARRFYASCFESIVKALQGEGLFRGLDPKVVTYGILGMLNWTAIWYKEEGRLSPEEIGEIYFRMLCGPRAQESRQKKNGGRYEDQQD